MTADKAKESAATMAEGFETEEDTIGSVADDGASGAEAAEFSPGTYVGRYMILSAIGRGGMGVVYKAYDPELDRRVALKLLRVKSDSETAGTRARDRLLREAQALARLSHPNVVSAFDVGTVGEEVFVAMELVEGRSLRKWLNEIQPSLKQKLKVMIAAGRGIAAAHQAGLIHRDIKPDNILVGDDGRVRVLDFGLARVANTAAAVASATASPPVDAESPESSEMSTSGAWLNKSMTLAGAVMGTPGYMAPEQYLGADLDEQSDQYSFCITLYEVLFEQKPYRARSFQEMKKKITTEAVRPPAQVPVPKQLRHIVMRGLSLLKDDRYANMDSLLADLSRDPQARKKRIIMAVAALLILTFGFGAAAAISARKQRLCQGASAQSAKVWNQKQEQALEKSFVASGRHYAKDTSRRVQSLIAQQASAWVKMRTEACEATHLSGAQSEHMLDLRMQCLEQRLAELQAQIELFANHADGEMVDRAVQAMSALRRIDTCADTESLTAKVPLPADPKARERIESLRKRFIAANALMLAGKYKEALVKASQIAGAARALDFAPLSAESEFLAGTLQGFVGQKTKAEESLRQAAYFGGRARNDALMIQATIAMMELVGGKQARFSEAQVLAAVGQAQLERVKNRPEIHSLFENALGMTAYGKGKYELAKTHYQSAVRLIEKLDGDHSLLLNRELRSLGNTLSELGQLEKAQAIYRRILQNQETELGSDHPDVGLTLNSLGMLLVDKEKYQKALLSFERARLIWRKVYGKESENLAFVTGNMALANSRLGKTKLAQKMFLEAIAMLKNVSGPQHLSLGRYYNSLGIISHQQKDIEKSLDYFQQANDIREKILGPDHPRVLGSQGNIGVILTELKRFDEARVLIEKTINGFRKTYGADSPRVGRMVYNMANLLHEQGKYREASGYYQQSLQILVKKLGPDHPDVLEVQSGLARNKTKALNL